MKKLLSLLSILTISGTAVPVVIAARSYKQKQLENINDKLNFSETSNLENLNRNKRETISEIDDYLEFDNIYIYKIMSDIKKIYSIIIG